MASEPVHEDGKEEGLFVVVRLCFLCARVRICENNEQGKKEVTVALGAQTAVSGTLAEYGVFSCLVHHVPIIAIGWQTPIQDIKLFTFWSLQKVVSSES